ATIVYSSGTGGRPKGCMLSHGAYLSQLEALMALYPLRPGHRVLSILPTNHAIDFMVGFIGPLACGASVVHQRTLRPEFILSTLREHAITHTAFVPALLEAIERSFDEELNKRPKWQRTLVDGIAQFNRLLGISPSSPTIAPLKRALGDHLEIIFAGGAFVDPRRAERFYALGLPVVIGYGLTECCTVATLQDMHPFRADSVGRPLPGIEVRIAPLSGSQLDEDGVGEVWIRGPTLMSGYLDDPELTQATITEDGWLRTGDLGWLDASHHLHLVGRIKNMIVTPGGKNVYPEDIEKAFEGIPQVDELCVFASGYVWPRRHHLTQEVLFAVVRSRLEPEHLRSELAMRNRNLPEHKRIQAFVLWRDPFPRTASLKIKREPLAQALRERVEPGGSGWMPLITTSSSPCAFSELRSARASENGQSRRDGIRVAGHHQS
ncbi:MAG: AMP-binding protein, partial [Deltaproteobacteria bacterium]|nr:AMP-binding protein [Deltaproteobacteria bacterium]